jgi:uncharacterized protein YbjT (DUF2867 family)
MNGRPGIILVAGATGNQGCAAARHLLDQGWKVRALTRNPDSRMARELRDLGAELAQGDFDDRTSLDHTLVGIYGVFMPSTQVNLRVTGATEIKYGNALIEAAKEAGVRHFVYSSEKGANKNKDLEYLASKGRVESRLRELGLPATILRHAFFVEWLTGPSAPSVRRGLEKGLKPDQTIQVISLDDIGAFTAIVFNDPKRFIGQEIEIAGDEATLEQIAQIYRRVKGKDLKSTWLPYGLIVRMGDFGKFIQHIPGQEARADIASLRILYPGLKNLEEGLRTAKPMAYPSKQGKSKKP